MKTIHNKLIRDNIPEIIGKSGKKCSVRVLGEEEYGLELRKKLIEEATEVSKAGRYALAGELADVMEVIDALKVLYSISDFEISSAKEEKTLDRGKFEKKLFLEYVIEGE